MTKTQAHHREEREAGREPKPTSGELFLSFLVLGLTGFGGVLPIARRMIVDKKGWLRDDEFVDMLGLCQFVPGGNILNMAVMLGIRFRGVPGAVAALVGVLAAPTAIAIALVSVYARFAHEPWVQRAFEGLAAAAAGLLGALAIRVAWPMRRHPKSVVLALLCFGAIAILRTPLALVVLCMTPFSILVLARDAE